VTVFLCRHERAGFVSNHPRLWLREWRWSNYETCLQGRRAGARTNQWDEAKMKLATPAAWVPTFTKNVKVGQPAHNDAGVAFEITP